LESKGLVSTKLGDPRPQQGGRPRRLVKAEAEGLAAVLLTTSAIQSMVGDPDVLREALHAPFAPVLEPG
jgi:hypothetical protein